MGYRLPRVWLEDSVEAHLVLSDLHDEQTCYDSVSLYTIYTIATPATSDARPIIDTHPFQHPAAILSPSSSPPYRLPAFGTLVFGNSKGNLSLAIRCAAASVLLTPIFERSDSVSADTLHPSSRAYCVILYSSTSAGNTECGKLLERSKNLLKEEGGRGAVRFLVEFEILAQVEEVEVEMVDCESQGGDVG